MAQGSSWVAPGFLLDGSRVPSGWLQGSFRTAPGSSWMALLLGGSRVLLDGSGLLLDGSTSGWLRTPFGWLYSWVAPGSFWMVQGPSGWLRTTLGWLYSWMAPGLLLGRSGVPSGRSRRRGHITPPQRSEAVGGCKQGILLEDSTGSVIFHRSLIISMGWLTKCC